MKIKRFMTAAVLPAGAAARERKKEIHAKRDERLEQIHTRTADRTAQMDANGTVRRLESFALLGVQIMSDGTIRTCNAFGAGEGRHLGAIEGAHAEVTDGARHHRAAAAGASALLLGPVGLLAGATTKMKATAFVVLADGTIREKKLDGTGVVRRAQAETVRFNAAVTRATS